MTQDEESGNSSINFALPPAACEIAIAGWRDGGRANNRNHPWSEQQRCSFPLSAFPYLPSPNTKNRGIPENTIDCKQFKKTGPEEWIEAGTAVFDLGTIKDINLTNQPVTPRHYKFGGIDLYTVVEQKCGTVTYVGNLTAEARGAPEIGAAVPGPELKRDEIRRHPLERQLSQHH